MQGLLPILESSSANLPQGTSAIDITPEQFFKNIRYVTLKVTNGCNLRCNYCNVEADRPSTPRMSLDVFKTVAELLLTHSSSPRVGLEFHGGEPLLMSDEWFEAAVSFARHLAKKHNKQVSFPLQTNGTLLSDNRLQTLRSLGIRIGLSIDGPPHINDRLRSAGHRVEKALKRLIALDPSIGVILVLSRSNYRDIPEIMDWFHSIGLRGFRFNFLQPQGWGTDQPSLSGDEMFEGVKAIFEHMSSTNVSVHEADTELMINRFVLGRLNPAPKTCWEYECQAGRSYCAVNHQGDVFACGTDLSNHGLGHIHHGFQAMHVKNTLRQLHKKDRWYTRCFDCQAHRICSLSCPTSDYNEPSFREASCAFTKRFYQYLDHRAPEVRRIFDLLRARKPQPRLA